MASVTWLANPSLLTIFLPMVPGDSGLICNAQQNNCLISLLPADYVIFRRNLFVETVADSEVIDEMCTNETECCSMDFCDRTVRDQVKYFINRNNSYR